MIHIFENNDVFNLAFLTHTISICLSLWFMTRSFFRKYYVLKRAKLHASNVLLRFCVLNNQQRIIVIETSVKSVVFSMHRNLDSRYFAHSSAFKQLSSPHLSIRYSIFSLCCTRNGWCIRNKSFINKHAAFAPWDTPMFIFYLNFKEVPQKCARSGLWRN